MNATPLIVTIDGPAGVGKSTLAKTVSRELGVACLDTGAMFRILGCRLSAADLALPDGDLARLLAAFRFTLSGAGDSTALLCNGVEAGEEIRSEEAGMNASRIATMPVIRQFLKSAQQGLGREFSLVAEGRDMGTVIFPSAPFKFFLMARPEVRAMRRFKQYQEMGKPADFDKLLRQIMERDETDSTRDIAPLKPAHDALPIDTSDMSVDAIVGFMLGEIRKKSPAFADAPGHGPETSQKTSDCGQNSFTDRP